MPDMSRAFSRKKQLGKFHHKRQLYVTLRHAAAYIDIEGVAASHTKERYGHGLVKRLGKEVSNMNICTAAIGSLTYAIKAQRALDQGGIGGEIVKLDASMTRRGCAYGVEFPCELQREVRAIMNAEKITVNSYINGGGGTLL